MITESSRKAELKSRQINVFKMKPFTSILNYLFVGLILASCGNSAESTSEITIETEDSVAVVEKQVESAWKAMQVKDEFGDIVEGKSIIAADFSGKMKNSATSDADLRASLQIQDSIIYTMFYEYSGENQARLPESEFVKIKVKVSSGEVLEVNQFLYGNYMQDTDKELLRILLEQEEPVKVIVDLSLADKFFNGIYNYEIDPNGLKEIVR